MSKDHDSEYIWCLHCERTYKRGEHRLVGGLKMCPYEGCDGDTFLDAWDWAKIQGANPEYPKTPVEGTVYPQYSS